MDVQVGYFHGFALPDIAKMMVIDRALMSGAQTYNLEYIAGSGEL